MAAQPACCQRAAPETTLGGDVASGLERLGSAVAVSPGLVVVGAPGFGDQGIDAGGVLVYRIDRASNRWIPDPWRVVPGAQEGSGFGAAIATDGAVAAAGSSGAGTVALFDLAAVAGVSPDDPPDDPIILLGGPDFGRSLSIDGATLTVGEPQRSGQPGPGRVVVFERDETSAWVETQQITVDSLPINAGFGSAVDLRGDRLLVGAPNADGTGRAFLFRRAHPGSPWTLAAGIAPTDLAPGDQFGASVALGERELVVGAPGSDRILSNAGVTYIVPVDVPAESLGVPQRLELPEPAVNALFGSAVDARGDLLAVGAPLDDGFAGSAWIFRRRADETFQTAQRLAPEPAEPFAGMGSAVAVGSEFIAAGAPRLDASPLQPDAGAVALASTL
ncbi:MAG: hypothetical protein AAFR96_09785, partial [Planctomycetota bacterium]